MSNQPHTLDDGNLARFVADGCLTVRTTLPADFHSDLYARIDEVFEKEGNPGNNLLPRLPGIQRVFDDPAVGRRVGEPPRPRVRDEPAPPLPPEPPRLPGAVVAQGLLRLRSQPAPPPLPLGPRPLLSPGGDRRHGAHGGHAGAAVVPHDLRPRPAQGDGEGGTAAGRGGHGGDRPLRQLAPGDRQPQRPQALHAQVPVRAHRRAGRLRGPGRPAVMGGERGRLLRRVALALRGRQRCRGRIGGAHRRLGRRSSGPRPHPPSAPGRRTSSPCPAPPPTPCPPWRGPWRTRRSPCASTLPTPWPPPKRAPACSPAACAARRPPPRSWPRPRPPTTPTAPTPRRPPPPTPWP